jgi:predicted permease
VTNVATLTVSLMRRRARELATRRSLGATDRRLLQQLLTEGALLGGCGTAVGLVVVAPLVRVLVALAPVDIPRLSSIHVDLPVVAAIAATGLLATAALATAAATRGRSLAIASGLKVDGDSRASARAGTGALMVAEVAVAFALTIVATLMVRSFVQLRAVDFGFTADRVVAARISLVGPRFDSRAKQQAFFDALLDGVRKLPGVEAAGRISTRPLAGAGPATEAADPMQPRGAATRAVVADIRYVDPALFRTLQIPIVQGAAFEAAGAASAPTRVVISESLAEALWPRQPAVGRRLHFALYNGILTEVAGVVRDLHILDPRTPTRPLAFLPDDRFPSDTRDIVVRAAGDAAIVSSVRRVVASLDPAVPLYQVAPLSELVDRTTASDRFITLLLSAFAAIALALGAIGVFGVISGDVARRRKEIGIRMALGARASSVVGMMLKRTLVPALGGVGAGSVLAAMVTYSMRSLLFGVAPHDTGSFIGVAALLMALAAVATLIPTRHALHASPVDALRES